jgi:hypothetical protein
MTTPARTVFEKLYAEMGLTANDAAWLVFLSGWNGALERAASQMQDNFTTPFGEDTVDSFAVFVRDQRE